MLSLSDQANACVVQPPGPDRDRLEQETMVKREKADTVLAVDENMVDWTHVTLAPGQKTAKCFWIMSYHIDYDYNL